MKFTVYTHGIRFIGVDGQDATQATKTIAHMYVADRDSDVCEPRAAVDFTTSTTDYNGHPCSRVEWDFVWGDDHPSIPSGRTRASALVFVDGSDPDDVRHF